MQYQLLDAVLAAQYHDWKKKISIRKKNMESCMSDTLMYVTLLCDTM